MSTIQVVDTRTIRSNISKYFKLARQGDNVIVRRPHEENVVVISLDEYNELVKLKEQYSK